MISQGRGGENRIVSCVIVAFHRPESLRRLLGMLSGDGLELLVVNVENDPRIHGLDGARVVPLAENLGYAAGVNLGARQAGGDIVVFMNDDVEIAHADVLRLAQRIGAGRTDVAIPLIVNTSGRPEVTRRPPYRLAARMYQQGNAVPDGPMEIDAAWAVVVAARAQLLRDQPLPEDYFLYFEEMDWFHRLRRQGTRVELVPSARGVHLGGMSVTRPEKSRLMARNAVRCVRRVRGRGAALRAWPWVIGWQSRLLLGSLLRGSGRAEVRSHAAGVRSALASWREI